MASPQCEDGYTRIANELLSALCRVKLTLYEWRVLMALIRLTYGYNRKMSQISLGQIGRVTGIDPRLVHRAIKGLQAKNMLSVSKEKNRLILGIQKDYERWTIISTDEFITADDIKSSPQMKTISSLQMKSLSSVERKTPPCKINENSDDSNLIKDVFTTPKDNIKDIYKDSIKDNIGACIACSPPSSLSATFLELVKRYPEFDVRESDLTWFEMRVEGNPQYQSIDIEDELRNWADWLETQHRKKEKKNANKFPKSNFKASLLNWLKKAAEIKQKQTGDPPVRWGVNEKHGQKSMRGDSYEEHIPSWKRKKGRKGFDLPSDYPIDVGGPDEQT